MALPASRWVGDPDPASPDRDDGISFQVFGMAVQKIGKNSDPALGRDIGKPDQPAVGSTPSENDPAEVGVDGNEDTTFLSSPHQKHPVTWVRPSFPRLDHIMAPLPKPLRKSGSCAPIDEKPHP